MMDGIEELMTELRVLDSFTFHSTTYLLNKYKWNNMSTEK